MANDGNLKNGVRTQFKAGEKQAEIARKGGVASGQAKRAAKTMSQLAQMIANSPASAKNQKVLESLGIDSESATNNATVVAGVYNKAIKGDVKAVDKWEQLVEASAGKSERYQLPASALGRAYVDINREIKPNMEYVFEGGRGSLKSSFVSFKIVELIKNNPQMHACITRQVAATLKDSVYARMKWAINTLGLTDEFEYKTSPLEIRYKKTGQVIYFRGLDDEIKLKSITPEFGYIGILWKEEKDQMKGPAQERSVNQSVLRGGKESYDFSTYNPPKSTASWVNRIKLEPNERRVIHTSTYLDVPPDWLGQKFIDDAEHLKEVNPAAYEHEYLGKANGEGGNVFEYIEAREITDAEIAAMDTIYQGCDYGWFPDPLAFVRLYYDHAQEKIYFIDELYVNKWANSKVADWIKDKGYDDYEIICDSAEPKSINDFRDFDLPARAALKGPGSVEYSMKWLQTRTLVIDPERTPNVYNEFVNYEYDRDRDGNVISGYPDRDNHEVDATRYALERLWSRRYNPA